MKLKLIPKNEEELSKLFVILFPLVLILSSAVMFLKNSYFTFANLLPHNSVFNYGKLASLENQISFHLLIGVSLSLLFVYLLSKSLGRKMAMFPLAFLTLLGYLGLLFLNILINHSIISLLLTLTVFVLVGISTINVLAKKKYNLYKWTTYIWSSNDVIYCFFSVSFKS